MPTRLLSSFLCVLLLLPQTICTCAVMNVACSESGCCHSAHSTDQTEHQSDNHQDADELLVQAGEYGCCLDEDDTTSHKSKCREVLDSPVAAHTPRPCHGQERHEPDCPVNQVNSDRANLKPQIEVTDFALADARTFQLFDFTLSTKGVRPQSLLPVDSGGLPLYVTHRALLI